MNKLKRWRWPILVVLPCAVLAVLFQFQAVRPVYEADAQLTYKGKLKQLPTVPEARLERGTSRQSIRLIGQGATPSQAVRSAETGIAALTKASLNLKKTSIRKRIAAIQTRQTTLSAKVTDLNQRRQSAAKGSRQPWTPEMAARLAQVRGRHFLLSKDYPTHTDIPVLAKEIKSLEAVQRGTSKVNPALVGQVSKQINEARMESSLLTGRVRVWEQAAKELKSDWTEIKAPTVPRWPVQVPGWPLAAGSVLVSMLAALSLFKGSRPVKALAEKPAKKIPLELAPNATEALPDNPQTREATAIFDRWMALVKIVYTPGPEAPKDIYVSAEPLFKETVTFLEKNQDTMTRHVARVVVPGDLFSHVSRTVLMALMGALEAGASTVQQQGMTFAALFHDLAVAPRPAHAWDEIGSEVGRLSSGLLRKIPGIPDSLLALAEDILVAMDEYPMETWQNVPRREEVASFAKLLNHIDRFDKVMQKQKTRITRRLESRPPQLAQIA